jgi:hypothetical protein
MEKKSFGIVAFVVLFLLLASSFSFLASFQKASAPLVDAQSEPSNPAVPAGVLAYVPITITNNERLATPAPFQQKVDVNSAYYSTYEAAGLQNIEFFTTNGSIIPSWLEYGANSGSTDSIYWLYLADGVPAISALTIYMGFASQNANLFNGATIGEAPELTSTYAQFDNGAYVFPTLYENFAGNSTPSGWTNAGATINDGVTMPTSAGTIGTTLLTNSAYGPGSYVLDSYANNEGSASVSDYREGVGYGFVRDGNNQSLVMWELDGSNLDPSALVYYTGFAQSGNLATTNSWHVFSIDWSNFSSALFSSDYGSQTSISTQIPSSNLPIGISQENGIFLPMKVQWMRLRASPPDGVMPSLSFGGVESVSTTSTSSASVISYNTALSSDLYCTNLTIASGVALTTNGYNILCSGSLTNYGAISSGNPGNGGITTTSIMGGSYPDSYGGSGGGGGYNAGGGGSGGSTLVAGGSGGTVGYGAGGGHSGSTPPSPTLTASIIQSMDAGGFVNYLSGAGGGAGQVGSGSPPQANGGSGGYGIYLQANQIINYGVISTAGQAGLGAPNGPNNGGGGGGGGGVIIFAYGSGGINPGATLVNGGPGGSSGSALSPGGPGGKGQVLMFGYGTSPPVYVEPVTTSPTSTTSSVTSIFSTTYTPSSVTYTTTSVTTATSLASSTTSSVSSTRPFTTSTASSTSTETVPTSQSTSNSYLLPITIVAIIVAVVAAFAAGIMYTRRRKS